MVTSSQKKDGHAGVPSPPGLVGRDLTRPRVVDRGAPLVARQRGCEKSNTHREPN